MLGDFASHDVQVCSTEGATSLDLVPDAGNAYYLVVPANSDHEGSYGLDGNGEERSPAESACHEQSIETCQ